MMAPPPPSPTASSSIQVVVRLRPMNEMEKKHGTLPVVTASTQDKTITVIKGQGSRQVKSSFTFDNVFGAFSSQEEVFEETLKPVIGDVMKGFESTVFAYGQTGTGKTHTMEGSLSSPEMHGVIPRAAQAIFETLKQPQYTDHTVTCSYLEIYNEDLRDLLCDDVAQKPGDKRTQHGSTKLEIMEGKNGTFCRGLVEKKLTSSEDVFALMQKAQHQRIIGETKMNKHSSRSHCIFTMKIHAKATLVGGSGTMECNGKLHMVDLAGSECAKTASLDKASGSEHARERERMNINRSLLTLGRVISMLKEQSVGKKSNSSVRIPYRDSKLTRILQESLGGRCKTVIVATLSPSVTAIEESMSTLTYAQSANGIINKPVATSYLSLTPGSIPNSEAAPDEHGNTVESWHEMECRLQYMQAQVEEAQAALARKHMQQQELADRAEKAEADRLEMEKKYYDATLEINSLKEDLAEEGNKRKQAEKKLRLTQITLKKTSTILKKTQQTEVSLTAEATTLLHTLKEAVVERDSLYSMVVMQRESEVERREATRDFHTATFAVLSKALSHLDSLSSKTEEFRSLVAKSVTDSHIEEHDSLNSTDEVLRTISEAVGSLADTMKSQIMDSKGIIPVLEATSSSAEQDICDAGKIMANGEERLVSSCRNARHKLEEYSARVQQLGEAYSAKSSETAATLEVNIAASREKIGSMIDSATEALSAAKNARAQAREVQSSLLSEWKSSSLDATSQVLGASNNQSESLKTTLDFFGGEMSRHDEIKVALENQHAFLDEGGGAHIEAVTSQREMLTTQQRTISSAQERQKKMRDDVMRTIMSGVQDIVTKQMSILAGEEERQYAALNQSNNDLADANTSLSQSAKRIVENVNTTNVTLAEETRAVRENDDHVTSILEKTKATFEQIGKASKYHRDSVKTISGRAEEGMVEMGKLDKTTEDILEGIKSGGEECASHLESSVLHDTTQHVADLAQSAREITTFGSDVAISESAVAIDGIMQPREEVMASFNDKIGDASASILAGRKKVDALARAQCDSVTQLRTDVESKKTNYETITASRRLKIDSNKDSVIKATKENDESAGAIISDASSSTDAVKRQVEVFATDVLRAKDDVAPAPERKILSFSSVLTSTPSDDVVLSGIDFDAESTDDRTATGGDLSQDDDCSIRHVDVSMRSAGSLSSLGSPVLQERALNRDNSTSSIPAVRPLKASRSSGGSVSSKRPIVKRSATPLGGRKKARVSSTPTRGSMKNPSTSRRGRK